MTLKAFIFDRDGTLNHTTQILRPGQAVGDATDGYVLSPDELALLPGVREALAILAVRGIKSFVFTQQNSVGKGLLDEETLHKIHGRMNLLLSPETQIDDFFYATHKDDPRAKPNPLMIEQILEKHALQKHEVVVAGDSMRDCKAAVAAGVRFAWVRDDLNRVSDADMQTTGWPIFSNVMDLVTEIVIDPTVAKKKYPAFFT